jgi:putative transposase
MVKNIIHYAPGEEVLYLGQKYRIRSQVDFFSVTIESIENGTIIKANISQIQPFVENNLVRFRDVAQFTKEEWDKAKEKFDIIRPFLNDRLSTEEKKAIAKAVNKDLGTLYRWLKRFNETGTMSSLIPDVRGGKGQSRLNKDVNAIINSAIEEEYLTEQRKSISKTYEKIVIQCKNMHLQVPHINTLRNRIMNISEEQKIRFRIGKDAAKQKFDPIKSSFPGAEYPLSVVQIDHTKVDIILVDEIYRKPIGRPWLTVAIDVFSRMVLGFYISFDPPGALATGMCISYAILPKELSLSKLNINAEWPCWGVMKKIYLDNAKEFHGAMLLRACQEYNIEIEFRPPKTPNYGGHIERFFGTLSKNIHSLPGTTFSDIEERKGYNSEKKAALTLSEFEKWLTILIVESYHNKIHSGINAAPIAKYKEGIFGSERQKGIGLPPRIFDERKLKLDFMPFVERTIQDYGVVINFIHYYDEVLRKWINSTEEISKKSRKRLFIFKIDPRDISIIYFYDPEIKNYYEIPYRDLSKPSMTIWEYRDIIRKIELDGVKNINEEIIFDAYKRMREIEENAIKKTKQIKTLLKKNSKRTHSFEKSMKNNIKNENKSIERKIKNSKKIKPFEDLDNEPFA